MSEVSANNKRIAKNTLMLYVRMFFTMAVSLYTSRVVLNTLGIADYGVYNVTGGVIAMFAFLNTAMSSATQRYITFALGKGNKEKLQTVFTTSVQIHFIISLFVLLMAETVGLWYVINKLVVPEGRETAAMWVYQCSILTSIMSIIAVPYTATIVAHERMSAFAYISILEVSLKLLIAFAIIVIPADKLITYAILVLIVQVTIRYVYVHYSAKNFEETKYHYNIDKPLFKEMASFAGWSFFGNFASVLYGQGVNMVLNVFYGPVINAARGIAVQVQTSIQSFAGSFQMAINPQITKNYASGDLEQMHGLMFRSSRFSFFLLFFLILPIMFETNFVLTLWLKNVPDNAVIFTQIMLAIVLLNPFSSPLTIANQATGKIKIYQIVVGGTLMTILPLSYIALKLGAPAYSVFIIHFIIESIAVFLRMYMLRNQIKLSILEYIKNIYIPVITVVIISIIPPTLVRMQFDEGWLRFILVGFTCVLSVGICCFIFGLTKGERRFIIDKVLRIIKKND